jgi:hypothetical protein
MHILGTSLISTESALGVLGIGSGRMVYHVSFELFIGDRKE